VLSYPVVGRVFLSAGIATIVATSAFAAPAFATSGGAGFSGGSSSAKKAVKNTSSAGDSKHLGDRVLRMGMSGHDVRVLQDF
jgi:hypothetical protein